MGDVYYSVNSKKALLRRTEDSSREAKIYPGGTYDFSDDKGNSLQGSSLVLIASIVEITYLMRYRVVSYY